MSTEPCAASQTVSRLRAILAGVFSVAAGLGVSQLVAAVAGGRSLVVDVGDVVIRMVPGWLEEWVITTLGHSDKPFLVWTILAITAALAAWLGVLAARRFVLGAGVLMLVTAVGTAAALVDPQTDALPALVTGLSFGATSVALLGALVWSARQAPITAARRAAAERSRLQAAGIVHRSSDGAMTRYHFLLWSTGFVAAFTALSASRFSVVERVDRLRSAVRLPRPARPAPPAPPGAALRIRGLTPLYVPNSFFYRVDTALQPPAVDPTNWSLTVKGRVDRPFSLSYAELMAMPQIEADVTLACVSNFVGGYLVGNARWQGVPLRRLLERAGLQAGATQVVGRSVDYFTTGFPSHLAFDVADAMVVVGMNGEPLPVVHGFPARLLVPGLYGYISATKWLSEIELTGWNDFDAYWIPRHWSKRGPIKTQSRIDVPVAGSAIKPGRRTIAGVAWAPTRGIARVEVRIDRGPWRETKLAAAINDDTWRQWFLPWDATPGRHTIEVRATDGTGEIQTAQVTQPQPNGASGHHTITVTVA